MTNKKETAQAMKYGNRKNMEMKIKASANTLSDLREVVNAIKEIEKEYNCTCTLLDMDLVTTL